MLRVPRAMPTSARSSTPCLGGIRAALGPCILLITMLELFLPKTIERLVVYLEPMNMRWGVTRLRKFCVEDLGIEPDLVTSFVFVNKARDCLLLFFTDEDGDQTILRKLDKGAFLLPAPDIEGARFVEMAPSMLPRLFRA